MRESPPTDNLAPSKLWTGAEWFLVLGVMVTLVWTTLCLGGYLAETMVVTVWAVAVMAVLGAWLWAWSPQVKFNLAALVPVPFLLYALGSVLWLAPAQWLAWREWLLWAQMAVIFCLLLHFGRGRRHVIVIVVTLVGLGLTGVAMAAYQRFADSSWLMLGRTQAAQYAGRSSGMFGIPNSLAALFELMIPLGLTGLFSRSTRAMAKIIIGWIVVLFVFGLVLTGSRGGWIGLGLALMLWPLLADGNWRKKILGLVSVLVVVGAGVGALFALSGHARERIQPFLDGQFETTRPIIWKAGLRIWHDHPWLGSGAASYNVVFDQYRPLGFLNEPDWAHNDYLNTLSDYGVVGFGCWLLAGAGLGLLGWRALLRSRNTRGPREHLLAGSSARLGLFLGLVAFGLHLAVEFHTKIPALAFAFAVIGALLVRDDPQIVRSLPSRWSRVGAVVLVVLIGVVVWRVAVPLYRGEALRFESRRSIDRQAATGKGDLGTIIPAAKDHFERAVQVDSHNGQAWADLSYAIVQNWHVEGGDLRTIGAKAEVAARRALACCSINAEYWVRLGVALDMQVRQGEGEACFQRAVALAPRTPAWWYYYAYHLQALPARKAEAERALQTCLQLDPYHPAGLALRQQLGANR